MDAAQVSIKINQTTQSDGGKTKSAFQTAKLGNSFYQILAMSLYQDQSSEIEGGIVASFQNDVANLNENIQLDPEKISLEDWEQLESIVAILAAGIQQFFSKPVIPQGSTGEESVTQQQAASSGINELQFINIHGGQELNEWLQETGGFSLDQAKEQLKLILQEVGSFIENHSDQDMLEKTLDIENEIKKFLNVSKAGSENVNSKTFSGISVEMKPLVEIKQNTSSVQHPSLSLDKNQLFIPSTMVHENEIVNSSMNNNIQKRFQLEKEGFDQLLSVDNNQLGTGSNVLTKSEHTTNVPVVPISQFVPEVRELLGRFIRITNGQSGSTEAKFSLFPEHLGHIEIKIASREGLISALILTDTSIAKDVLEGQLQQLKQAMQQHGLQVQRIEIVQQTSMATEQSGTSTYFTQSGFSSSQEQQTFTSAKEYSKRHKSSDEQVIDKEFQPITYGGANPMIASRIDFIV